MGFGGDDEAPAQTTQTRNVPEWVERAGKRLYEKAEATTGKGPGGRVYEGQRVASMHPLQNQALGQAHKTAGAYEPELQGVDKMLQQQYNHAPANVTTGRNPQAIQFNRFTGSAPNSLFGEYYEKMYKPAASELNREASRGLTDFRRRHAFGGQAFGSGRVLGESQHEEARQRALQNLQGNIFNQAMNAFQTEEARNLQSQQAQAGIHQADLARQLQADLANQTAGMQNKNLNLQAANQMMNNIMSKYNMNAQDIARLFTMGQAGQGQNQREIDAAMQKFNEMNNYDRLEFEWLARMLSQNPGGELTSRTSTNDTGPGVGETLARTAVPLSMGLYRNFRPE